MFRRSKAPIVVLSRSAPIALDPTNRRCAIAADDYIHVLLFDE
jgi:hypothetical protein